MTMNYTSRQSHQRKIRLWAKNHKFEILERFNNRCNKCGTKENLTIHHKEYEIGFEFVGVLCNKHHRKLHAKETKKKFLLLFMKDLDKFRKNNYMLSLADYRADLQKRFDDIKIKIIPHIEEINGL